MRTLLLVSVSLSIAAAPLAGQTPARSADPDGIAGGSLPAGWRVRLDQPQAAASAVKFVAMGDGFHATMGPAAIFYDAERVASGEYTARATFTQTRAPRHPEAYGLLIGGRDLDGEDQDYLYFLVRQDGRYLVKHRAGAETHTLVDWTEHAAVRKADAQGRATNALAVEVRAGGVRFLVNGTEVTTVERAPYMNTDGIVGLRVNHNLDVHIAGFGIERAGGRASGRGR